MLTLFPLLPYTGPQPVSSSYVITAQNASRWILTAANPLGQFTSFMVFDGGSNVLNLLLSAFMVFVLLFFMDAESAWSAGFGVFITTNLAGILSPTAIYFAPPSNYGSWGMSSATFAPVGFAFIGCLWVLLSMAKPKMLHKEALSVGLLVLFVLLGLVISQGMGGSTITWTVFHVHALSFSIGGIAAALVFWRAQAKAGVFHRPAFRPLESRFPERRQSESSHIVSPAPKPNAG